MTNIRLVSAEITNRSYTKKTPECSLSGVSDALGKTNQVATIITNIKAPLTIKAKTQGSGSVTFYSDNGVSDCRLNNVTGTAVALNSPYTVIGEQKFVFSGPTQIYNWTACTTSTGDYCVGIGSGGANFKHNLDIYKVKYGLQTAIISSASLSNQVLRTYYRNYSGSPGVIQNQSGHAGASSASDRETLIDPCIATNENGSYSASSSDQTWCWNNWHSYLTPHGCNFSPVCYGLKKAKFIAGFVNRSSGTAPITMHVAGNNWTKIGTNYPCSKSEQYGIMNTGTNVSYDSNKLEIRTHTTGTHSIHGFFFANLEKKTYSLTATKADIIANKYIGTLSDNGDNATWLCFCGDGELEVTVQSEPGNGTIAYKAPDGTTNATTNVTTSDSYTTITISPETHNYVKGSDGKYTITLILNNVQISDPQMASTDIVCEFSPLRPPSDSRVVDFSQNVSGKPAYTASLVTAGEDGDFSRTGIEWNAELGHWVTKSSPAEQYSGWNYFYRKGIAGDFFLLVEDIGTAPPDLRWSGAGNDNYVGGQFYGAGLMRFFDTSGATNAGWCSFYLFNPAPGGKCKMLFGGFTRPVNTALYYGASGSTNHSYEWQSYKTGSSNGTVQNLIGNTPTAAVQEVTKDACAKLKTDHGTNLRIYVVKYRKQANYMPKFSTTAVDFNYTDIDNCATDATKVYDVAEDYYKAGTGAEVTTTATAEANLKKALDAIAADIKSASFAGYAEAKNVP
jgi:hypothetical protein